MLIKFVFIIFGTSNNFRISITNTKIEEFYANAIWINYKLVALIFKTIYVIASYLNKISRNWYPYII
jgi:hypothetical protein